MVRRRIEYVHLRGGGHARRLALGLRYRAALWQGAPLDEQVRLFPAPRAPDVWWADLAAIAWEAPDVRLPGPRFAVEGAWDVTRVRRRTPITEPMREGVRMWRIHNTVRAIFVRGEDYRRTPQFEDMVGRVRDRGRKPPWGCRTVEDVHAYFGRLIAAFGSMEREGYRAQADLGGPPGDEVRVLVTRDGRLVQHDGGRHRIRMAEVLGIERIPFLVVGAHPAWVGAACRAAGEPPDRAVGRALGEAVAARGRGPDHEVRPHFEGIRGTLR